MIKCPITVPFSSHASSYSLHERRLRFLRCVDESQPPLLIEPNVYFHSFLIPSIYRIWPPNRDDSDTNARLKLKETTWLYLGKNVMVWVQISTNKCDVVMFVTLNNLTGWLFFFTQETNSSLLGETPIFFCTSNFILNVFTSSIVPVIITMATRGHNLILNVSTGRIKLRTTIFFKVRTFGNNSIDLPEGASHGLLVSPVNKRYKGLRS